MKKSVKMRYRMLLAIVCFHLLPAIAQARADSCSLKLAFDMDIPLRLYTHKQLLGYEEVYPEFGYDTVKHIYLLTWPKLTAGNYTLALETVFGDRLNYKIKLQHDTLIAIESPYQLAGKGKIALPDYATSKQIRVYYKISGCFTDEQEELLIASIGTKGYIFNHVSDSFQRQKDTLSQQTRIMRLPSIQSKIEGPDFIHAFIDFVADCKATKDKLEQEGKKCHSTSHQLLFVLSEKQLFCFSDDGVCDWQGYLHFLHQYFK